MVQNTFCGLLLIVNISNTINVMDTVLNNGEHKHQTMLQNG